MGHGFRRLGYLVLLVGLKIVGFFFPVWGFSLSAFPSAFRRERGLESVSQARAPALRRLAGLSASHCRDRGSGPSAPSRARACAAAAGHARGPAALPGAVRAGAALRLGWAPAARGLLRSPAGPHGSWWRVCPRPSRCPVSAACPVGFRRRGPGLPLSPPPRSLILPRRTGQNPRRPFL